MASDAPSEALFNGEDEAPPNAGSFSELEGAVINDASGHFATDPPTGTLRAACWASLRSGRGRFSLGTIQRTARVMAARRWRMTPEESGCLRKEDLAVAVREQALAPLR